MPARLPDGQLSDALFQAVKDGTYPENDAVVSAELPASAFEELQALLERARDDVKTSIRELSRISAPDIDGWIAQAKQLRADIVGSQELAHEIVALADESRKLQDQVDDAAGKVDLLNGEVDFNEHLVGTLQQVHGLRYTLDSAQQAALANELPDAIAFLKRAERELSELQGCENTRLAGLIRAKVADLHQTVAETLTDQWNTLIHVDIEHSMISVRKESHKDNVVAVDAVVAALSALDLLKAKILTLRKAFEDVILTPRLAQGPDGTVGSWAIEDEVLRISGRMSDESTETLFSDMNAMIEYLSTHLPSSIAVPLSENLLPTLTSKLVSGPLLSSVPPDLDGIPAFKTTLDQVQKFIDLLDAHNWHGKNNLRQWMQDAPRVWLNRRSEYALHMIRKLLLRGLGDPRTVERVETQVVTKDDSMFVNNGNNEDWNAEWSDDEVPNDMKADEAFPHHTHVRQGEEEDGSAWGLNNDSDHDKVGKGADPNKEVEDEGDAWGWGDDNETDEVAKSPRLHQPSAPSPKRNGNVAKAAQSERQLTLKETYKITALPEQISEIIFEVVSDAHTLARLNSSENPVASAAAGLFLLPGLLLSMYRASAPSFYTHNISGNMFLYNDSLYMAEQLRRFIEHQAKHSTANSSLPTLDLNADISALELFGKRAYGREMESQRTILGDLLDGAQGLANCTEQPFAQQCDLAISSTVDRLREIYAQWKPVLSHSALLQSIGSLLGTVINKIIIDIEDMSDISEPESQRLTSFCTRVAALEDLFVPETAAASDGRGDPPLPRTAVYTPYWLKFQYLTNILESSLVDIKYLWTEGELSLEFGAEELIDLIEALFADSEHRRKAIGEIRRSSRGR